jgi:DNA-directed RNA polymerase subunit beta
LLEVQLNSFEQFLQRNVPPAERKDTGLQKVFNEIFPISDIHDNYTLEFIGYTISEPKYTVGECQERDMTYAVPLKATLRLIIRETIGDQKRVKDVIEQEVYLGEIPLITDKGTFIINGAERVVVCQLHRSPGVIFNDDVLPTGKKVISARIIPDRGSWVEFTLDYRDVIYVHIDKKRKLAATVLLKALGFAGNDDLLNIFCDTDTVDIRKDGKEVIGKVAAETLVDINTGEILLEPNNTISENHLTQFRELGIEQIKVLARESTINLEILQNTRHKDNTTTEEEALYKIYTLMRPGDPPSIEAARKLLERMFFNPKRYHLGKVGRYRINERLHVTIPEDQTILCHQDFIEIIRYLLKLRKGEGYIDDIDHLGNRRIRTVGELLSTQLNFGLSRMSRTIRERMSLQDSETITPYDLVNARTVSAVISTFFGSSQLSQFMDQTNPLAELTHKRRLSALGPGGLTRERAGFEVRDVHHTHYGRMCPIETPEGPNIGLITSLCTYTRVNDFGFLETPYRKVVKGHATGDVVYLSADREDLHTIAQANTLLDKKGKIIEEYIKARHKGEFMIMHRGDVDLMDISPNQIVSVAASLIPFLEHDDANRALMGSNMQRQAVPLLNTEGPIIGTGMERQAAVDSGSVIVARRPGKIEEVTADHITIVPDKDDDPSDAFEWQEEDRYNLKKFKRSNQDTCINERPIIRVGQKVKKGDVIADGSAVKNGELALGKNVLVAFMSWAGYNFEDAIVVSERLLENDSFTSIHIEEFEIQVRDTKRGSEEITKEIPNVSEEAVRNLDEDGIVRIGAEVHAGDILVGKVTPKGETELSPEERLLRAIFGEKAGDVRDASLKAPPGMNGIVIDVKVFSRREKDERSKREVKKRVDEVKREFRKRIKKFKDIRHRKLKELFLNQEAVNLQDPKTGRYIVPQGEKITREFVDQIDFDEVIFDGSLVDNFEANLSILQVQETYTKAVRRQEEKLERELEKITRGDELPPGIVKLVKVYIARKRTMSVGDKIAGRHGNKGVLSKIVPVEDMPYLPDGTPIDIILNPLGVPSRMNVGQILETHLGWAAKIQDFKVASPVFDGASLQDIEKVLEEANLSINGKSVLFDGRTSEPFDQEVTVGYMYLMKLSHLVEDKIHARSIGPYSLVTQQPLGGKAQFGGQRFGEMEVWAIEAYGAAYTLQELLTVKSDDVIGRSKVYEAIVKGDNAPEPGVPESFNVLIKELQSLGLDVQLLQKDEIG